GRTSRDPERRGLRFVPPGRGGGARVPAAPRPGRRPGSPRRGGAGDREALGPVARQRRPAGARAAAGAVRLRRARGIAASAGRAALALAARRRAVERYSVERMVRDYAEVVEALGEGRG